MTTRPCNPCVNVADQCRSRGLTVGDTVEGIERLHGYWHAARLTLLWLGEECAAFRVTERSIIRPEWSEPTEQTNWTLSCRDWKKIDE